MRSWPRAMMPGASNTMTTLALGAGQVLATLGSVAGLAWSVGLPPAVALAQELLGLLAGGLRGGHAGAGHRDPATEHQYLRHR